MSRASRIAAAAALLILSAWNAHDHRVSSPEGAAESRLTLRRSAVLLALTTYGELDLLLPRQSAPVEQSYVSTWDRRLHIDRRPGGAPTFARCRRRDSPAGSGGSTETDPRPRGAVELTDSLTLAGSPPGAVLRHYALQRWRGSTRGCLAVRASPGSLGWVTGRHRQRACAMSSADCGLGPDGGDR
jgi:hypothetical protein